MMNNAILTHLPNETNLLKSPSKSHHTPLLPPLFSVNPHLEQDNILHLVAVAAENDHTELNNKTLYRDDLFEEFTTIGDAVSSPVPMEEFNRDGFVPLDHMNVFHPKESENRQEHCHDPTPSPEETQPNLKRPCTQESKQDEEDEEDDDDDEEEEQQAIKKQKLSVQQEDPLFTTLGITFPNHSPAPITRETKVVENSSPLSNPSHEIHHVPTPSPLQSHSKPFIPSAPVLPRSYSELIHKTTLASQDPMLKFKPTYSTRKMAPIKPAKCRKVFLGLKNLIPSLHDKHDINEDVIVREGAKYIKALHKRIEWMSSQLEKGQPVLRAAVPYRQETPTKPVMFNTQSYHESPSKPRDAFVKGTQPPFTPGHGVHILPRAETPLQTTAHVLTSPTKNNTCAIYLHNPTPSSTPNPAVITLNSQMTAAARQQILQQQLQKYNEHLLQQHPSSKSSYSVTPQKQMVVSQPTTTPQMAAISETNLTHAINSTVPMVPGSLLPKMQHYNHVTTTPTLTLTPLNSLAQPNPTVPTTMLPITTTPSTSIHEASNYGRNMWIQKPNIANFPHAPVSPTTPAALSSNLFVPPHSNTMSSLQKSQMAAAQNQQQLLSSLADSNLPSTEILTRLSHLRAKNTHTTTNDLHPILSNAPIYLSKVQQLQKTLTCATPEVESPTTRLEQPKEAAAFDFDHFLMNQESASNDVNESISDQYQ